MLIEDIPAAALAKLRRGTVIPAQPLALDANRQFDRRYQRALTRYYMDSGVGGIAVGVHMTQFAIRDPNINLFEPVLRLVSREIDDYGADRGLAIFKIAGVCGRTEQATREAKFACSQGYHACLLSLSAMACESHEAMLLHCQRVAEIMPVIGFYLQPAVGGCVLPYSFWRRFAGIDNILAIKIAPFNRYQTLDVVRAICDAGNEGRITLYTGNDDNIVVDLLTEFRVATHDGFKQVRIRGGLLGHWSCWTKSAVDMFQAIQAASESRKAIDPIWLTRAAEVTDCNAAFFDAANGFSGCICGVHEVLRRQGLLPGNYCLDPEEQLSPGQIEEIDRVHTAYPHLHDDAFVYQHIRKWLDGD